MLGRQVLLEEEDLSFLLCSKIKCLDLILTHVLRNLAASKDKKKKGGYYLSL